MREDYNSDYNLMMLAQDRGSHYSLDYNEVDIYEEEFKDAIENLNLLENEDKKGNLEEEIIEALCKKLKDLTTEAEKALKETAERQQWILAAIGQNAYFVSNEEELEL